tara:strand:+ start:935 stop:1183 length:249 start_codon:yes stop_codon:yes gene_type:complete
MTKNLFNLNNNKIIIILLLLLLLFLIFDKNLIEANSNKEKCKFNNEYYEKSAKRNEDKMKKEADSISSKDSERNSNIQALSG